MGRKKKKPAKPWCWYCNREFDDEKILIQHQKAKHFKCHVCHRKLYTGPGLAIHALQVHKEHIDKIPNAIPDRSSVEIEIYGMEGIPEEDLREHERQTGSAPYVAPPDIERPPRLDLTSATTGAGMVPMHASLPPMMHFPPPPRPPVSSMGYPMPMFTGQFHPPAFQHYPPISQPPPNIFMPPPNGPPGLPPFSTSMPPVSMLPPLSVMSHPPMISSYTSPPMTMTSVPSRPLFPSVSGGDTGSIFSSIPVPSIPQFSYQNSVQPVPAPSDSVQEIALPTLAPSSNSSNQVTKIFHPDEDISLEEQRARHSKYKSLIDTEILPSGHGSVISALPPSSPSTSTGNMISLDAGEKPPLLPPPHLNISQDGTPFQPSLSEGKETTPSMNPDDDFSDHNPTTSEFPHHINASHESQSASELVASSELPSKPTVNNEKRTE